MELRFIRLINKYRLAPVKACVRFDDFKAVLAQNRGPFKEPSYFALAEILIGVIGTLRLQPQREKVEFFFDEDLVSQQELKDAYGTLKRILPPQDAGLIENEPLFRDDKAYMPLQAADLFAWHVRRELFERERGARLETPSWKALCQAKILDCSMDRQDMAEIVEQMTIRWLRHLPKSKARLNDGGYT